MKRIKGVSRIQYVVLLALALCSGCGGSQFTSDIFTCEDDVRFSPGFINVGYQFAEFSDGVRFVTCEVRGGEYMSTESKVHVQNGDPGYATGECNVTYDLNDNTGGFWGFAFDVGTQKVTVRHIDPGSPFAPSTVVIQCARGTTT